MEIFLRLGPAWSIFCLFFQWIWWAAKISFTGFIVPPPPLHPTRKVPKLEIKLRKTIPNQTTSMEDDINGRQPQWKMNSMEDDQNWSLPNWKQPFFYKTSWGWAGPRSEENWIARQSNVVILHWGCLPLMSSSIEIVFHWSCLPLKLSFIEVVFNWGCLN